MNSVFFECYPFSYLALRRLLSVELIIDFFFSVDNEYSFVICYRYIY